VGFNEDNGGQLVPRSNDFLDNLASYKVVPPGAVQSPKIGLDDGLGPDAATTMMVVSCRPL